jgi:hypothetical protein
MGGFTGESKYTQVTQLNLLLTIQQEQPLPWLDKFLRLTLNNMARLGLHDLLGGGFFHYADASWQQPHFEKTLYDNALLICLYLRASAVLQEPDYAKTAYETLDFALREPATTEGSFIAGLSAIDETGKEGSYYLWRISELVTLLNSKELQAVQQAWGMKGESPFPQGGYLPRHKRTASEFAKQVNIAEADAQALLESARNKLLKSLKKRPPLPRDTKKLAAWNGLMLSALAQATQYSNELRYRIAGNKLRDYLLSELWKRNRLLRAMGPQGPVGEASLEDYAYVARGLLDWYAVSQDPQDLDRVKQLVDFAWKTFYDQHWYLSEQHLLPMEPGVDLVADDPLPSPAALLIDLRLELDSVDKTVCEALALGQEEVMKFPFLYATHISVVEKVVKSFQKSRIMSYLIN